MKFAFFSLFLVCSFASCVPSARTNQLVPVVRSSTQTGQAVIVNSRLSSDQSRMEGLDVPPEDFKNALEQAVVDSGLFRQIGAGGYQLDAIIVSNNQPMAVFSVTTEIEVAYTLRKDGAVRWERTIRSSHVTETRENSVSEFRNRMSTEGAMRENIRIAIGAMSERLK